MSAKETTPFVPNSFGAGFPTATIDHNGYKLFITNTTLVILAGVFVGLRFWVRIGKRTVGAEDWLIVVSLLFGVSLTVTYNMAVSNGYGVKKAQLTKAQHAEAMMWFYMVQIVYKLQCLFTKLSLILLYRRIFTSKGFQTACYIALAVVLAWSIGSVASSIWQCVPIQAAWDTSIKNKTCVNTDASWYQYGIINILTDVGILVLPIMPIMKLQLNKPDKLGLLVVFAMGGFVCVISICRVVIVSQSIAMKEDTTGNFIPRGCLTVVEAHIGIVCACLPTLGNLLLALLPLRMFGGTKGRSYELNDNDSSRPHLGWPKAQNSVAISASRREEMEAAARAGGNKSLGGPGPSVSRSRGDPENDSIEELLDVKEKQGRRPVVIEVRRDISVQKF